MRLVLAEIITGIMLIIIAVCFLSQAILLPESLNQMDVGAAAFPKLIIYAILLFSVILIVQTAKKLARKDQEMIHFTRGRQVFVSIVILAAYIMLISLTGYYIATAIGLVALLLSAEQRKWKNIVWVTGFFLLFAKVGFEMVLQVNLP